MYWTFKKETRPLQTLPDSSYRCFVPDLTEFTTSKLAGTGSLAHTKIQFARCQRHHQGNMKRIDSNTQANILILRFSSMGDILLATVILDSIKKRWPQGKVHWVTHKKFQMVLENNPLIDELHCFQSLLDLELLAIKLSSKQRYSHIFDLHKNPKSYLFRAHFPLTPQYAYYKGFFQKLALIYFKKKWGTLYSVPHRYLMALDQAQVQNVKSPSKWTFHFPSAPMTWFNDLPFAGEDILALAPFASYFTKAWPLHFWRALIKKLTENGRTLCLIGSGQEEVHLAKELEGQGVHNLVGKLNLAQTARIIQESQLLICNDTGPMHLAQVYKTPVIGIFGPSTRELGFFPSSTLHKVIEVPHHLSCRPCSPHGRRVCPKKHFKCMLDLTPQLIFDETSKMLKKSHLKHLKIDKNPKGNSLWMT